MFTRALIAGALAVCLTGCAKEKFVGRPGLEFKQGALPAPSGTDLIEQQRSYVVGPYDKVSIEVFGVPDLSRTIQVDAGGTISMPLVGTLVASGQTPSQIAANIANRLRGRYVRDPQVVVNTDTVNQLMTVDGMVKKPGQFPVLGRQTLLGAISRAEGESDYADSSYVVVFRRVNNQQMAALYDLRAIRQGIYADPEVYANDTITVGESNARRFFQTFGQTSVLLIAPLITLLK